MTPVERLIDAFHGLRPLQRALGEKHASLIQGWKEGGRIPHYRKEQVLAAADRCGVKLPDALIAQLFPDQEERRPARKKAA